MLYAKSPKRSRRKRQATIDGKPVSMERLREFVIARDRRCLAAQHSLTHLCRDRYGKWDGGDLLSLEHVTKVHGVDDGRHDDERHTVALCYWLNGSGPTLAYPELRAFMRFRLRTLYPECGTG